VDAAASLTWIDWNLTAVLCPGEYSREHGPGVIGRTGRFQGEFVAPVHERAAGAEIRQRLGRHITELDLDLFDMCDVVATLLVAQAEEILTALIVLQQP